MSLFWPDDPSKVELTQPRLHVFIIGVGDYPHLVGGGGHPAVANFGLQQLTTTVITAEKIANWFASQFRNPDCPLGSIELLLSPSAQLQRADGSHVAVAAATMQNIRDAFDAAWYPRCDAHAGNIALFYFAGHGINTASQFLLAQDFGDPAKKQKLWDNCIDFDGLRIGMRMNTAETQLFFADSCREKPIDALLQLNPTGNPLVNGANVFDQVNASAAYYAAADGQLAYGPKNDVTYFAAALLESLDGVGATKRHGKWVVDTFSLSNALGQVMDNLATLHKQPLSCNPDPAGIPAPIHFPQTGAVRTTISCATKKANDEVAISLQRGPASHVSQRGHPRPWIGRVEPGDWNLGMNFLNFPPIARLETLVPPVFDLSEPV